MITITTLSALFPKAQSFQNRAKTEAKKRNASFTVKTVLGAVGPFKNKKTRHQNIRKQGRYKKTRQVDQTRPGVPKGTVADKRDMRLLGETPPTFRHV